MTVIALCGLRVSQPRHLAVVSIKIRFCDRFVTSTALVHNLQFESGLISPADRMCRVAIGADRQLLICMRHKWRVNAGFELFLDSVMTLSASGRHIRAIHARKRIRTRSYIVRSVTTRAHGRYGQSALHQPLAVNALRVVFDDLMLCADITDSRLFSFTMAACTEAWDIRGKCH